MRHSIRKSGKKENKVPFAPVAQHPTIQTNPAIGQPHDKYEQETNAVADKEMMMPNSSTEIQMKPLLSSPDISMECAECKKSKQKMKT